MEYISDELKVKIKTAHNAQEVADLLRDAGADESTAEQVWQEIIRHRDDKELSLGELEAISGGARNVFTEGCAATVEAGSDCYFTDYCSIAFTMYDVYPVSGTCSQCGGTPVYADVVRGYFFCSRCGCRLDRNGNVIHEAKQGDFPDFKF